MFKEKLSLTAGCGPRLRQHDRGCGRMRQPTVQVPSQRRHSYNFSYREAASDRLGRSAEHPLASSSPPLRRSCAQLVNLANIAAYVVARIVLVQLSEQASEEFQFVIQAKEMTVPVTKI